MRSTLNMNASLHAISQDLDSSIKINSRWDAVKKGLITLGLAWALGLMLVLIPFINWTLPAIFLLFGPILAFGVYLADRRGVERIDAVTTCPHCKGTIEIHEMHVSFPLYGSCPHCKTAYQVHLPELEYVE